MLVDIAIQLTHFIPARVYSYWLSFTWCIDLFQMTTAHVYGLEMLCISGNILSGIIACNIWRMPKKTHLNQMFCAYFTIDCVIGLVEPFFLFKLKKERYRLYEP